MAEHQNYLRLALAEAKKSPPKPTNFCVGAVLASPTSSPPVLATGYTLELPGNTHAEQCCLRKLAAARAVSEEDVASVLPEDTILYTTMEPCNLRLSGNLPCVDRVLKANIRTVCIGVQEPEKFVGENEGRRKLEAAGVKVVHVTGFEDEIIRVATAGHAE